MIAFLCLVVGALVVGMVWLVADNLQLRQKAEDQRVGNCELCGRPRLRAWRIPDDEAS